MVAVVQLVEHQVVILAVAGSSPVSHPDIGNAVCASRRRFCFRCSAWFAVIRLGLRETIPEGVAGHLACPTVGIMKVLVAKRPSRPLAAIDRWSATEGEVVVAPFVCGDAGCGCDVVHQGITSHGYTTLAAGPWAGVVNEPAELDLIAEDLIQDMCDAAARHPAGTLLRMTFDRRRGSWGYQPLD
jgi:hypothetical protein